MGNERLDRSRGGYRGPRGRAPASGSDTPAPRTQELVDEETRRIVDAAEEEVVDLLERERERLEALARSLLEQETLDQTDAYRIAGVDPPAFDAEQEAKAVALP